MTPDDLVLTPFGVRFRGRVFPCTIGKSGLSTSKQEGDSATPTGVLRITGVLYRADKIAKPAPWALPIGPRDLWSDDPTDGAYNQLVRAPYNGSHERLRRADPLYDLVILTDWNWPNAVSGKGSAIFLHQWRRRCFPTEGCVAFRRDHLRWIARRAPPGTRLIIPQA